MQRVKPPSAQKNKFHLVPGTKRQPAEPPARAPAQRTHCFLKSNLWLLQSINQPVLHTRELPAGLANGSKTRVLRTGTGRSPRGSPKGTWSPASALPVLRVWRPARWARLSPGQERDDRKEQPNKGRAGRRTFV